MALGSREDTIVAIATPPGLGGIGVIRIAGPGVEEIARQVLGRVPRPRVASLCMFLGEDGQALDQGIALYFRGPASFTGDDVLELQGHGGPVVLDRLVAQAVRFGARLARPGEFSERAFINGKLDLTQAEAIADLIEAQTTRAADLAMRNLCGEFARRVGDLVERVIELRTYIEVSLDFPEEDVDILDWSRVQASLSTLRDDTMSVVRRGEQGRVFRDGIKIVIGGSPNVGKSSLMNTLAGSEAAIVTAMPGTTRDLLREYVQIDGLPIQLMDTAGVRATDDPAEREGICRAIAGMEQADQILWVFDETGCGAFEELGGTVPARVPITWVRNKIDLLGEPPGVRDTPRGREISLSALTGAGVALLREEIKKVAGVAESLEGELLARRRHLLSLERAVGSLNRAVNSSFREQTELVAEDLREVQRSLGEITGEFSSDDLLDRIFSSFCIGK